MLKVLKMVQSFSETTHHGKSAPFWGQEGVHIRASILYILDGMTMVYSLIFQILTHKAWQWILIMTPSMSASLEMTCSRNKGSSVRCRTSSHTSGTAAVRAWFILELGQATGQLYIKAPTHSKLTQVEGTEQQLSWVCCYKSHRQAEISEL